MPETESSTFVDGFHNPPADFPRRRPEEPARFTATDRETTAMNVLHGYKNAHFPRIVLFRNENTLSTVRAHSHAIYPRCIRL